MKNRPPGDDARKAALLISPDALALVRFGLRAADDPRIVDTVKAIDAVLKAELPQGPVWYRYNDDGYGEHADGAPFDGTGIGRAWPLLTGERAHYELAAGRIKQATALLATLERSAGEGGMLPEQVWDTDDVPERELFRGRPSGSAMPLVWAHSEHIKLLRSLRDGRVFDLPPQPVQRYQVDKITSPVRCWRFNQKRRTLPAGKALRLELPAAATVHWTLDDWGTIRDDADRSDTLRPACPRPADRIGAARHAHPLHLPLARFRPVGGRRLPGDRSMAKPASRQAMRPPEPAVKVDASRKKPSCCERIL